MNIPDQTPVTRDLDEKGITYKFFKHDGQVHSLEQAARERGQRPEQIIRSILFRIHDDEFIMVLVAGPQQISWPRLREYLGISRMTMASREEVLKMTGYPTGAVSPFGLPQPIRVLVDQNVFIEDEVSIGSGVRNSTVILKKSALLQALGKVEIGDFLDQSPTEN